MASYNTYQQDGAQNGAPPAYNPAYNQAYNPAVVQAVPATAAQPDTMKAPLTNPGGGFEGIGNENDSNPPGKCQDCLWIPVFIAQLITVIALSIYYYSKSGKDFLDIKSSDNKFIDSNFWGLTAGVVVIGFLSSVLWILFIRKFSYCLIWFSLILTLSMWIAFGIISMILGNIYGLIIGLIFAAIQGLWMWCVQDRIAFAAAVLEMAVTACNEFSGVYLVSFLSIFIQAIWVIIWVMGFAFVIYDGTESNNDSSDDSDTTDTSDDDDDNNNNINSGVVFLFLLSLYWTAQVIANTVHVTCAGSVATWYFLFPIKTPKYPVSGSLKRAMTTSFGSICFGSFLIAFLQAVRAMLRSAERRGRGGFITCCVACILACLQNILEYFNLYAFTRVAMYGQSYCQAAKETWNLFKSKGFDAIINDDLTGTALAISCVFASLLSACIVGIIAYLINNNYWYVWGIIAFFVTYALAICAIVVVRSGIATIFVCFAEDPSVLSETKPEQYDKITTAWRNRYGKLPARLTNPPPPNDQYYYANRV